METLLTKGTIGVIPLENNHTSEYIKNELLSILKEFKIDPSKIVAIVTNSASNMIKATAYFPIIKNTFHV